MTRDNDVFSEWMEEYLDYTDCDNEEYEDLEDEYIASLVD
jgi:hypothetical protein